MSDKVTVYWSPFDVLEEVNKKVLLNTVPTPLLLDIQKRRNKNPSDTKYPGIGRYHTCTAIHTFAQNIFVVKAPFSAQVNLDEYGYVIPTTQYSKWFTERDSSTEAAFSIDFNLGYLLFCEEPLDVIVTPAYLHKSSLTDSGFVCAGRFDISSWFRVIGTVIQLWENKRNVKFSQGEALYYLQFDTKKEVIFQEFNLTKDILDYASACTSFKTILPFQPLDLLYKRFRGGNLRSRILRSIKENLVK